MNQAKDKRKWNVYSSHEAERRGYCQGLKEVAAWVVITGGRGSAVKADPGRWQCRLSKSGTSLWVEIEGVHQGYFMTSGG